MSDPNNQGNWVLNTEVSDEFNASEIDEDRWYIVGKFKEDKPFYKHPDKPNRKVWKGRAPSQFSGRNYRLEDGILNLEIRWEPDFPFSDEIRKPIFGEAMPYANITTAYFIGRREFKFGYIEIRSKSADTQLTSGFWSMGKGLEMDFFESYGHGVQPNKRHLDSQLWWSIRDWTNLRGKPSYTERKDLGYRMAEDFHVYDFEWNENGVKYFVDGKLLSEASAEEVTERTRANKEVDENYEGYVAKVPIHVWLDMETFPWHGYPKSKEELEANSPKGEKEDGIVDFKIDYAHVL